MLGRAAGRNSYSPYAAGRRRTGKATSPKHSLDSLPRSPSVRLTVRGWWEGAVPTSALLGVLPSAWPRVAGQDWRKVLQRLPRWCQICFWPQHDYVTAEAAWGWRGVGHIPISDGFGAWGLGRCYQPLPRGDFTPRNQGSVCLQQFCIVCYWRPGRCPHPRSAKGRAGLGAGRKRGRDVWGRIPLSMEPAILGQCHPQGSAHAVLCFCRICPARTAWKLPAPGSCPPPASNSAAVPVPWAP